MENNHNRPNRSYLFLFIVLILMLAPVAGFSEPEKPALDKKNTELHITSDYLISDRNANYAEFQGNVVATQEGSVLTSERLKITYTNRPDTPGDQEKKDAQSPVGAIETIAASGHVKIVMEDKTAWSEVATFNRADDTIILTGGNPKVVSGKSTVSGEKIIMNRTSGQVSVFRGKGQRVEAFFYQDDVDKANKSQK